jgi:hypothetical protein
MEHVGSSGKADGLFRKCQVRILAATLHFMRDSCRSISQILQANDGIGPQVCFIFLLKSSQLTSVIYTIKDTDSVLE